jgi:hypothetical protein
MVKIHRRVQQPGKGENAVHRLRLAGIWLGLVKILPARFALAHQLLGHELCDIVALGVEAAQRALLLRHLHDSKNIGVLDHHARIDGEHLEGGDALFHQRFHRISQLIRIVPGRYKLGVDAVVQSALGHFTDPFLHRLQHGGLFCSGTEIHKRGDAAESRAFAGSVEIQHVDRVAEGSLHMHVRLDQTGHHILSLSLNHLGSISDQAVQRTGGCDMRYFLIRHADVGPKGLGGRHHSSASHNQIQHKNHPFWNLSQFRTEILQSPYTSFGS